MKLNTGESEQDLRCSRGDILKKSALLDVWLTVRTNFKSSLAGVID